MIRRKKWIYKNHDENLVEKLCGDFGFSRLTASVLQNRTDVVGGFNSKEQLSQKFYDPFILKDMDRAVAHINKALARGEKITIFGDYDADGVTSTAVLYMYLKEKGAEVDYYIPDRIDEGYGMNTAALDRIRASGTTLIITVDTGVTAVEETEYAKSLGLEIIVTDHHECKSEVPDCVAVIDPKQEECPYPYKELAGVGVAFKLVTALEGEVTEELIKKYMPLVSFGTIADVAPLTDENRRMVSLGLKHISGCGNHGITALLEAAGLSGKPVTASNIGFVVAPRINAAGRLGNAYKSVKLFVCNDNDTAQQIAYELSEENKRRQTMERVIFDEAVELIEKNRLHDNSVIVVASKGWHHGVIGIVSSKITEKYYKPSILISIDGGDAKGSGRSIAAFNLFDALTACSGDLGKFGGHALAAGLSLPAEKIDYFSKSINKYARGLLTAEDFIPSLNIDAIVENKDMTLENISQLKKLEPYGMGNPMPVFACKKAKITRITTMSEGAHVKMYLNRCGFGFEAIGFHMGDYAALFKIGDFIDLAGTLSINEYKGEVKLQLIIKDIKKLNNK